MLPGIVLQTDLDWKNTVNYYIPTIKRYNNKLYAWLAPNGPQLGGAKTPGTTAGASYWKLLEDYFTLFRGTQLSGNATDWNLYVDMGWWLVYNVKGTTLHAPVDETSWWWVCVANCNGNILQEARRFNVTNQTGAEKLSRQRNTTGTWGPWVYDYAQYYS